MSKRRMFSQDIVGSDAFNDMPATAQLLYFQLCMNADDDGFVSPRRIMRMIGANEDDLRVLIAKRFVLAFPDTSVVVIKHWRLNNFIRNDRYKKTTYTKELEMLTFNEFGAYTELLKIPKFVEAIEENITTELGKNTEVVNQMTTVGIPNDIPTVDPGKVRLGKVSNKVLDKSNTFVELDKPTPRPAKASSKEFIALLVKTLGFSEKTLATEGRIRKLQVRLKTFTPKQIVDAARALSEDEYMQGSNDSGKRYGTIDYLLRSDEIIDKYLNSESNSGEVKSDEQYLHNLG